MHKKRVSKLNNIINRLDPYSFDHYSFLKTCTGKIPQGASLSALFTMLSAIKDSGKTCGIKVSGGVKTPRQAFNYAKLAELMMAKKIDKSWFRIGASSLLNELLKQRKL